MAHNHGCCPHCGWPADDPGARTLSLHPTTDGDVRYRRCPCGAILVTRAGTLITAARPPSATSPRPPALSPHRHP